MLAFWLLSGWAFTAQAADRAGNLDPAEQRVVAGINQIRSWYGLGYLQPSRALTDAANAHSHDMAQRRYYGHDTLYGLAWNQRIRRYVRARVIGETLDLLRGPEGSRGDAATVVRDWLRSPAHRAVLLTRGLRRIGVAHAVIADGRPAFFAADFSS